MRIAAVLTLAALLSILCFHCTSSWVRNGIAWLCGPIFMVNIPVGLDIGTGYTKVSGGKRSAVFPTLCAMAQAKSVRNVEDMDIGADGGSGIIERVGDDAVGLDLRRAGMDNGSPSEARPAVRPPRVRHGRAPRPQADRRKAGELRDMRRRHLRCQKIQGHSAKHHNVAQASVMRRHTAGHRDARVVREGVRHGHKHRPRHHRDNQRSRGERRRHLDTKGVRLCDLPDIPAEQQVRIRGPRGPLCRETPRQSEGWCRCWPPT